MSRGTFVDSDNILDLVLTTERDRVGDVSVLASFPRCHHCPVVFEYVLQFDKDVTSVNNERLLWCKGNYGKISAHIMSLD